MAPNDSADEALLALFRHNGITFDSAEDAWQRSEPLFPLLGWLAARFPEEEAFEICLEWLRLCAMEVPGAGEVPDLFAQARGGGPRQGHISASALGDQVNRNILDKKPAVAAFADCAAQLCEVWAAVTTGEVDEETDPWRRAQTASQAMVSSWLMARDLDDENREERARARSGLVRLLRTARGPLAG
ncbi:hypothetical protein DRW03_25000 [Corallococcus sp. H22C18031201]|uniref:hypothetical protein n=1 Tax=Citreicoccus inhibens TaxID=2849499 RepID=UPI000E7418ED|nr:hypothetical protein [Citreicoccus inhibens]MBU8899688.1 hypothetical protein [Citreicoccus inhibens]RJS18389.1 hypothetical protein DRW03_25000 [Corallococcus sp. H22C18031201]